MLGYVLGSGATLRGMPVRGQRLVASFSTFEKYIPLFKHLLQRAKSATCLLWPVPDIKVLEVVSGPGRGGPAAPAKSSFIVSPLSLATGHSCAFLPAM